jgi:hypothetical protein
MKLFPAIVTLHLLGGLVLLALLRAQSVAYAQRANAVDAKPKACPSVCGGGSLRRLLPCGYRRPGGWVSTSLQCSPAPTFRLASNRCGRHGLQPGLLPGLSLGSGEVAAISAFRP